MPEQFGDKSQEATPHRRQKAREDGQVAKSQDLSSAVVLVATILALMYFGGAIGTFLGKMMEQSLSTQPTLIVDSHLATSRWAEVLRGLSQTLLPLLGVLLLVAILVNVSQVGFLFLPKKVALDPGHVNPLKGIKRIFSLTSLMRLIFGVFKIMVVTTVAFWSLWSERETILSLALFDIGQIAWFTVQITLWTCLKVGGALLLLAIFDYAYQRWKHEQDLRMTTQEIREEMKNLQGDPQVVARRRAVQRQLALDRLSSTIPSADVVVTNPTELAVAVRYDPETMSAPIVVAKGAGVIAQRIRRLALENDIPIVERKELAQFLYKNVEVNQTIPAEQYAAIAEVLRYVYELTGKTLPNVPEAA